LDCHQIIHRDIKPGNFLFNLQTEEFMLVDFGLAQMQTELWVPEQDNSIKRKRTLEDLANQPIDTDAVLREVKKSKLVGVMRRQNSLSQITNKKTQISNVPYFTSSNPNQLNQPTIAETSCKKTIHIARAGTRGFRAPEVLLKYPKQTVSIDVWSAGVIFLSILSGRYPFFKSPDDMTALAEIAALCGTKEVQQMATSLGRRVTFPTAFPKWDLKLLCERLSSNRGYRIPNSAYDLLQRCLELHPNQRITSAEAFKHPFFFESS